MTRLHAWLQGLYEFTSENLRHLVGAGIILLFLGLFARVTWQLYDDPGLEAFDRQVLIAISLLRTPAMNGPAVDITALGSGALIILFSIVGVIVLGLNREIRECIYLAVGSAGAGAGNFAFKALFSRDRPSVVERLVEVDGYSYPSGHSLAATSFYLLLMFIAWRHYPSWWARGVLLVCASVVILAVSFSRLYLGVHYPSDVLSGMCLGIAWVCLLTAYFSHARRKSR
jgi:undecaprenyl-diphosphatase